MKEKSLATLIVLAVLARILSMTAFDYSDVSSLFRKHQRLISQVVGWDAVPARSSWSMLKVNKSDLDFYGAPETCKQL